MNILFLTLFCISSTIHLYASYKKNVRLRAITKPFLLIFLLIWYLIESPQINVLVILAIFFSWLGDVLLIPKGVKWFTAGGIAFMISHFFFVTCYAPQVNYNIINPLLIALIAIIYITAVCFVFKGLKNHLPKVLFYPMFLYLLINGTMNCFACYQLLSIPCLATAITFIGAMLFFASDSILFYVRFNKETIFKSHFPVMITYIFAELLIVYGIILVERMI